MCFQGFEYINILVSCTLTLFLITRKIYKNLISWKNCDVYVVMNWRHLFACRFILCRKEKCIIQENEQWNVSKRSLDPSDRPCNWDIWYKAEKEIKSLYRQKFLIYSFWDIGLFEFKIYFYCTYVYEWFLLMSICT